MPLPFSLTPKDIVSPIVAAAAALVSIYFAWRSAQLNSSNANRSIYVDGQKFLIEVCKLLVDEPVLWCLYDDEDLRSNPVYRSNDPLQHAKLRAFAHLHLNMFEIIVNEVPKPNRWGRRNASNVWYDYLEDTLNRCSLVRSILEEPKAKTLWSDALNKKYGEWKDIHERKHTTTPTDPYLG